MIKKVIFLHIPKAGGSTLRNTIANNYDKSKIYQINTRDEMIAFKNLPREVINRYDCIAGHMGFGFHRYFDDKIEYITVLRETVDRIISLYYYILRTPTHYLYHTITKLKMTLDEFVDSNLTHEICDGQTRLIASQDGLGINFETKRCLDNNDLERAKSNLVNHFAVVGILERFDEFLPTVAQHYGWTKIACAKQNVSNNREKIESINGNTIASIKRNNQIDIQLYEFARSLFDIKMKDSFKTNRQFI